MISDVVEEDPEADTKETVASGQPDRFTVEDPEDDTKESVPRPPRGAADSSLAFGIGKLGIAPAPSSGESGVSSGDYNPQHVIEEDPQADTKESAPHPARGSFVPSFSDVGKLGVASSCGTGKRDNSLAFASSSGSSASSGLASVGKLGVTASGLGADNSVAMTSDNSVVIEDPDGDTVPSVREVDGEVVTKVVTPRTNVIQRVDPMARTSPPVTRNENEVHKVIISYPPHAPRRLSGCYQQEKVLGDGEMLFGRLAPFGRVQIKLNDKTISKRQFSLTLVHKRGERYFEFRNMSSIKTIKLNGETLGHNESRRLPLISRMSILDLDPDKGEGESLDLMFYVETLNDLGSYKFEVTFKCDLEWATNFATALPTTPMNAFNCPASGVSVLGNATPFVPTITEQGPIASPSSSLGYPLLPPHGLGSPLPNDPIGLQVPPPGGLLPVYDEASPTHLPEQCSLSPNVSPRAARR